MKLVSFKLNGHERVGILSLDEKYVSPLEGIHSMIELIKKGCDFSTQTGEKVLFSTVERLSPIPNPPQDIICLGMNYPKHSKEMERQSVEVYGKNQGAAVYFSKRVNCCIPDGGQVYCHSDLTQQLDYEAELAVVLGKDVYHVQPDEVSDCIFGYTIINDISARDLQKQHKQFYFGKSLETFAPMGPCILTADAIAYPPKLRIWCQVNGELRQSGITDETIFSISDVLCELSRGMLLPAGTIIAMGTPEGVGIGFDPPRFLKPGDTVVCGIEGIGTLTNIII